MPQGCARGEDMNDRPLEMADGVSGKAMLDALPSLVSYWDRQLLCRYANAAYSAWFNTTPEALLGRHLREVLGESLFTLNEVAIHGALAGQAQRFERFLRGPDGGERHSLARYIPDSRDGEVVGFMAYITETTGQKQSEQHLRATIESLRQEIGQRRAAEENAARSERVLSDVLSSFGAGIVTLDAQGDVLHLDATAEHLLGWTDAQARGRSAYDVLERVDRPPGLRERSPVEVMVATQMAPQRPWRIVLRRPDGRHVEVQIHGSVHRDADGVPSGGVLVLRDLSRAQALDELTNRLAAVVESTQDAIVSKNLNGIITSWNPGAEGLFGFTAEEAIGRSIHLLIPPDRLDEEARLMDQMRRGQRVPPFETVRRHRDGRFIDVSVTLSPVFDGQGHIVGASKIARDVGSLRREEAARRRAEVLEEQNRLALEASRMKSQFLANMSHELRTPLNAIIGFADLVHNGVVRPGHPKYETYLGHISSSGRHLLRLINDVLDLSKVESGTFEFRPEAVDMTALVGEVVQMVQHEVDRKRQALQVSIDPQLGPVELDPGRLRQVLYNFVSNAIKFTPPEGRVWVRAMAVGEQHLRLEVEDTGVGISETEQAQLFTEFRQLDSGYSKQHQGTGLGLALTKRLVEAQGGVVGVRSRPGAGSLFYAVLNRVHGRDEVQPREPQAPSASGAGCLLALDDEGRLGGPVRDEIHRAGFQVDSAADALQAQAHFNHARYDGLTLALDLPGGRGLSLLADLRATLDGAKAAPVLGLTAKGPDGRMGGFAVDDLLGKPLQAQEVDRLMRRCPQAAQGPVLVIDDDPVALELMRTTLQALGHDVVCRQDGPSALRDLALLRPRLIILDLVMPNFSGLDVLEVLQRLPAGEQIPVVVWTSLLLSSSEREVLGAQVQNILSKGGGRLSTMLEKLRRRRVGEGEPSVPTRGREQA